MGRINAYMKHWRMFDGYMNSYFRIVCVPQFLNYGGALCVKDH